ncbi:hypothetical protein MBLNU457_g0093t1 [Dothideomycetes sp. NU457]
MDISKWLCGTTLSPPPPSQQADRVQTNVYATQAHGRFSPPILHRSKRIAPIADSSVIELPQEIRHAHKRRRHRSPTRSESKSSDSGAPSESDSSSGNSEPSQAESSSEKHRKHIHKSYDRRPRHKTRPDKYLPKEPRPRKSKSRRDRKKDAKPKKRRRTKDYADDAKDLVKNFKTTHVANDRLTLLPNLKSGLYKQGRASVPMRGKGLPDLTFSEMKFLQSPDDSVGLTVEKQISKMRKDKKRREQNLDHEQEISAYFGVTDHRRDRCADPPPFERIPKPRLESQRHIERHSADHHALRPRSSSHFHRESSRGVGSKRPRDESDSGITWPETLPVGASVSTHGVNLKQQRETVARVIDRPRDPPSNHSLGNNHQREAHESDGPEPRTNARIQSNERIQEPERTRSTAQEEVIMPPLKNTTGEAGDTQKSVPLDDRQATKPHLKDHEAVALPAEKSSSSPLTKALRGCERALEKAAQTERAGPHDLRPRSPPPQRAHEFESLHRQYYDSRPSSYASGPHSTRPIYASRQQSAPCIADALLYGDVAPVYLERTTYPYECDARHGNDMCFEERTWNEGPLLQGEQVEGDVEPWPEELETFDQYEDMETMIQDREAVNEAEDGTVLAGFWKPNRLY